MRDSMGRFMPGHEKSNSPLSDDSKNESTDGEGGVETSTRSLRYYKRGAESDSFTALKASEHRKARRESDSRRHSSASTSRQSLEEAIEGPEKDFPVADMTSTDDPFEEFDVESGSEKEFLIDNLRYDAPQEDVEQLRAARNLPLVSDSRILQQWDTAMDQGDFEKTVHTARSATAAEINAKIYELILSKQDENGQTPLPSFEYPAPHLVLQQKVEEFARSHIFSVNRHIKPTTLQRREFTRDIYDYARAVGMGRNQANAEVLRARATYRHDRGLPGGLKLDESEDESILGLEINDAAEYIATMMNGMQRGPVDPAGAWDEIARLEAKIPNSNSRVRKRKREKLDNNAVNGGIIATGRPGDAESSRPSKKHKRRKLKHRYCSGSNQELVDLADKPAIPKSKKELKKAMRRKRATLRKSEGRIDVKPEEKLLTEIKSKHAPIAHSDSGHIRKASDRTTRDEAVSAGDKTAVESVPTKKLNQNSLNTKESVRTDVNSESWDLRKKRNKKKRKRRSSNNPSSVDEKAKAESAGEKTNNNSMQTNITPLNMDHPQRKGEMTARHEKMVVKKNTTDDSGEAIPSSELMSTNSNKKMQGRRDRGRGKKAITTTPKAPGSSAIDESLGIDEQKAESGIVKAVGDSFEIGGGEESNSDITTTSQIPETGCEVVISTPSNTWWSHGMTKWEGKVESIDFDSSTSVLESTFSEATRDHAFTMSERSLEWDHSGPEFDEIKVEPKVKRSSPLKSNSTTPTKASRTRSSSTNLQTPNSERKSPDASNESTPTPTERVKQTHNNISAIKKSTKAPVKSPFFSPPASAAKLKVTAEKKTRLKGGLVSCIPFPPLSSPSFGLLQEKLSHDPFRLLVGVTFLNRTMGKHAIPVFFSLMEKYPTPADILAADKEDIISMTRHLGLQAQRAETYRKFAHFWIHDPPVKGKRYRVDHYPELGDGMDIKAGEIIDDEDPRVAWEIGHMTKGRYAIDSWRIFCRDILRGEAEGWNGEGREDGFQPEWMRVQPRDKELVACLRWMWLKEGFSWDPVTGEKEVADTELMEAAIVGKIAWDDRGGMRIVEDDDDDDDIRVETRNDDNTD